MRKRRRNSPDIEGKLSDHSLWRSSYFRKGHRADFSDADVSGSDFQGLDLSGARFQNANMRDSNLIDTIFHGANLQGADLSGATMFDTVFRRVDLSEVRGLDTVIHYGPSTIGLDTLLRSRGRISPAFLVGTGVPLEAVPGLLDWARKYGTRPDYYSAFISYGGPDEQFALRLHRALRTRGVETFVFAEHAGPGMKLYEVMSRYVNEYDRILIVCSRNSLVRPGVMNELDEALRREAREGGSSLVIPIALDDYVFSEWDPEQEAIGRALRDRVIGDFRTAADDQKAFLAQVDRLVKVLRKPQKGRSRRVAQQ